MLVVVHGIRLGIPRSGRPKIHASPADRVEAHRARAAEKAGVAAQHASINKGQDWYNRRKPRTLELRAKSRRTRDDHQ